MRMDLTIVGKLFGENERNRLEALPLAQRIPELRTLQSRLDNKSPELTTLQNVLVRHIQLERMQAPSGIIDESEPPSLTILLIPEDYPKAFRTQGKLYAHPDDYEIDNKPISPDLFLYKVGTRVRIFLRLSLALDGTAETKYTTGTFLLDTGACPHFYLSVRLWHLLKPRIQRQDVGDDYIVVKANGEDCKCVVKRDLPDAHQPANVMGLPMLFLLGLQLVQKRLSVLTFDEEDVAREIGASHLEVI
ncbi:hypothetical protein DFS34DRAFT_605888 [Phlyctochytrium arcticum]|nr:hypothetical protein DFS34DRAFT_605888 [Phlyctochytrium arcticum]